jgi:hypothetical protein
MSVPASTTELPPPGIPHPDNAKRWLVPPWPADSTVHDLVQHFQRFAPAMHASPTIQAAYYSRYAAELAATPSGDLASALSYQRYGELLSAITRAASSAEAEHEHTLDQAKATMQLSLVRMFGLNSLPIEGQAL